MTKARATNQNSKGNKLPAKSVKNQSISKKKSTIAASKGKTLRVSKTAHCFTSKVLMVEPTAFYSNEETLQDNRFMETNVVKSKDASTQAAVKEFKGVLEALRKNNIDVTVYK